ncbi:hypothetical protein Prudu_81S000100 [Prunus dulcis]|uniref:Uncharacterized protein n=1 Tax=Prunus dulcis TaxID=3755 RepID=A0A5H2XG56_PRUDU|nr:hypothetical protein Prudu_81S000100 [Prunus dulcis]
MRSFITGFEIYICSEVKHELGRSKKLWQGSFGRVICGGQFWQRREGLISESEGGQFSLSGSSFFGVEVVLGRVLNCIDFEVNKGQRSWSPADGGRWWLAGGGG